MPWLPASEVPAAADAPAPSRPPVRTLVTVRVSPASTSLSLSSTEPLAWRPGVPLAVPPASMAVPASSVASGLSLAPRSVMVSVAGVAAPLASRTV